MSNTTTTISNHCHLCGSNKGYMHRLHEQYCTKDITFLCDRCTDLTNAHLNKIKQLTYKWHERVLQIFLTKQKETFTTKV